MPFKSETYRVLIASPSDLGEERQAVTEAVNDWNAQHAAAEAVVLLPVKWETHATPQVGIRPQEAINDQLVRKKKALIGSFSQVDELRHTILRDLMSQVRKLKPSRSSGASGKLDQAEKITNLIRIHQEHNITPEGIVNLSSVTCTACT